MLWLCPHLAAVPAGHHELLAGAARGEVRVDARGVEEAAVAEVVPYHGMVTRPMVIVMLFTVQMMIMMLFCHVFAEFMNQENKVQRSVAKVNDKTEFPDHF